MSGTLYGVGTAGYSWAATITDANAYRLDFYHLGIIPHSSYYRANGFPLRCLQEEVRPKGCFAGLAARKRWLRKPQQNALWACRAAPGRRLRENDTHRVSDGESGGPPARGGVGPGDPTGRSCSAYSPLTNHQQRKFVLGRGAARGGGGSRDSSSRNFLTDRPIPIGCPKNCSAQRLLAARLGRVLTMAVRRLPPRRVRNIRFAHLRPRRRRTEKPLRPTVSVRAPCDSYYIRLTPK